MRNVRYLSILEAVAGSIVKIVEQAPYQEIKAAAIASISHGISPADQKLTMAIQADIVKVAGFISPE